MLDALRHITVSDNHRNLAMRMTMAIAIVLALAGCAAPADSAHTTSQPSPGTITPFIGASMTVGAAVGHGSK